MRLFILMVGLFCMQQLCAQPASVFNGRWCFSGSRSSLFIVKDSNVYVAMVSEKDSANFNRYLSTGTVGDDIQLFPVYIDSSKERYFLTAHIRRNGQQRTAYFIYNKGNDSTIYYIGNVYADTAKIKTYNANCRLEVPGCSAYLYKRSEMIQMSRLKNLNYMNRNDMFRVLETLSVLLKNYCNLCAEGLLDAMINRAVVINGFNPFHLEVSDDRRVYRVSAARFLFDNLIGTSDKPIDRELYEVWTRIKKTFNNN